MSRSTVSYSCLYDTDAAKRLLNIILGVLFGDFSWTDGGSLSKNSLKPSWTYKKLHFKGEPNWFKILRHRQRKLDTLYNRISKTT